MLKSYTVYSLGDTGEKRRFEGIVRADSPEAAISKWLGFPYEERYHASRWVAYLRNN